MTYHSVYQHQRFFMIRLFIDQAIAVDSVIDLDADLTHRLNKVMRARVGDEMVLFNGQGGEFTVELMALSKRHAQAKVLSAKQTNRESALEIQLIQGISRGNRMDYTIQKAVELGVAGIIPVATKRSMVKLTDERKDNRHDHWLGVIQHACEQSGRTAIPQLAPAGQLEDIATLPNIEQSYFLDTQSATPLSSNDSPTGIAYLIAGPEGGFNEEERSWIRGLGGKAIKLGPRILRTETAALAALSIMQHLWGDLG
jgi:16S rRNA (uracil1498-N3)-methyltransferase